MNRIYYFSSTGNTLAAAREFAEKLGDTELISIADLDRAGEVGLSGTVKVGDGKEFRVAELRREFARGRQGVAGR